MSQDIRWIPVSERLPDIHRDVLLFTNGWDGLWLGYLDEEGDFIVKGRAYSKNRVISHWMELPESAHTDPTEEATK